MMTMAGPGHSVRAMGKGDTSTALVATQTRIDDRGRDLDHTDPGVLQPMPQAERKRVDCSLGGAVNRNIGHRRKRQAGADIEDVGVGLPLQQRQQTAYQMDWRSEVDSHLLLEGVHPGVGRKVAMDLDARIVDDGVEGGMLILQPLCQCVAAGWICHIADARDHAGDFSLCLRKRGCSATADDDLVAVGGKVPCQGKTDSRRAASDEDSVVCELHRLGSFAKKCRRYVDDEPGISGHTFATGMPGLRCRGYPEAGGVAIHLNGDRATIRSALFRQPLSTMALLSLQLLSSCGIQQPRVKECVA